MEVIGGQDFSDEEMDNTYWYHFNNSPVENTNNLLDAIYSYNFLNDFLTDEDLHVPLFPSTILDAKHALQFVYDFDGVVLQIKDLSGLKIPLNYLFVAKVPMPKLQNHWSVLKKHMQLDAYSAAGLAALRRTYGTVLAFVDGGHYLILSVVSALHTHPGVIFNTDNAARANAVVVINTVFNIFHEKVKNLPPEEKQRETIMKNNTFNLGRMYVLKEDQAFVSNLFMEAIREVNTNPDQSLVLSLYKFGQKSGDPIHLSGLIDLEAIESISLHAACTIRPAHPKMELLWSRQGLQQVVGFRGTLFSTYGMAEAGNYQSNLDQHPLTIDDNLRVVFNGSIPYSELNFVQLYSTTPHCYAARIPNHPVSRVITTCGLHNPKHSQSLLKQAKDYMDSMRDLSGKTNCRVYARMEGVFLLRDYFPETLQARHFYNERNICKLIEDQPMFLIFLDNSSKLGLRHVIHPVTDWLTESLYNLLQECKGLGGYTNSWTAFQYELALEELFFGKPNCKRSVQFSVSLGTNSTNPNSVTRRRGFLGLSPPGSASVGEDPPPLTTWFNDQVQTMRVMRIFPITDSLKAPPIIVGEALVLILLSDLHERNSHIQTNALKDKTPPQFGKLIGCRTVTDFCRDLVERDAFKYPHTFQRAIQLVEAAGQDVQTCLKLALSAFKFFPAIVYWDENRNAKAKWNKKDYVELYGESEIPSTEAQAATLMGDICAGMERANLTYRNNLQIYKERGMPWLHPCLQRLPKTMSKEQKVTVLTFLSSIAMIQNGDFILFSSLGTLVGQLPMSQQQMQQAHLLSPLILIHSPRVNRLHSSVPYKVPKTQVNPSKRPTKDQNLPKTVEQPEDTETQAEEEEVQLVERVESSTVPANVLGRWTPEEVELVRAHPELALSEAYKMYLNTCREMRRPVRTFQAFKKKRQRVL